MVPKSVVPHRIVSLVRATRADTDEQLLKSWVQSLNSPHSRRNFEMTAERFFAALPMQLRRATVEDVRDTLGKVTTGLAESTARQYVLRIKSLLGYAHSLGYTPFNAGARIKVRSDTHRGAALAKRIISETEVALLIRAAPSKRDRVLLEVGYAGGLRVSELVGLTWADVLPRDKDQVQLSITGKGGFVRQVLLPDIVSRSLLSLRGDAGDDDAVFPSRKGGGALSERAVHGMVKRAAAKAHITGKVSPHWLRHAHGSHAIDRGASLPEVQATLGHGNISTTSGYLHARPSSSSGLKLDPGVFLR